MMNVDDIIVGLEAYGFIKRTENSKTIGYSNAEQTVYVKRENKRQPLILHPENQNRFTTLSAIAGVIVEKPLRFYHNSTMRAFPERLNTGAKPTKYGLAFGFSDPPTFQIFMSNLLSDSPSPLASDLIDIAFGVGSSTEREYLLKARIGQGVFRDGLMEEFKGKCPVTNISRPELLRASHIKPWRKSNNMERLDTKNGLLLSVHIDALFDSGLISFDSLGKIRISSLLSRHELEVFGIDETVRINVCATRATYLRYHEEIEFEL